ncbi:Uncharacterised protein [Corynebacterium striatum]|nr:Uncharacterised protein [Corynebacterium striatum]
MARLWSSTMSPPSMAAAGAHGLFAYRRLPPTRTPTMRSPKDLQAHASKYLRNHFAEALADPDSVRVDWPLHPPTATAAAAISTPRRASSVPGSAGPTRRTSSTSPAIGRAPAWARTTYRLASQSTVPNASPPPRALTSSTPAPVNERTASLPSFPIPPTSPTPSAAAIPNGRI